MDWKYVKLAIEGELAYVSLNRPEKMNAINYQMFKELDSVIKHLGRNRQLRAVILFGEGENFSSGLDVKSVAKSPASAVKLLFKWLPGNANLAQRVSIGWQRLPIPVIAVIHGRCYGGGTQIALGADFRIATPDAELSIMEARWGLLPDMAGLVNLREILPKDKAMKLSLTAEVISGDAAHEMGLVSMLDDKPMQAAKALALELAKTSPDATAAIKLSINYSWSASIRSLLSRESWSQVKLLLGKNRLIAAVRQTKDPQKPYKPRQSW